MIINYVTVDNKQYLPVVPGDVFQYTTLSELYFRSYILFRTQCTPLLTTHLPSPYIAQNRGKILFFLLYTISASEQTLVQTLQSTSVEIATVNLFLRAQWRVSGRHQGEGPIYQYKESEAPFVQNAHVCFQQIFRGRADIFWNTGRALLPLLRKLCFLAANSYD
jgi:hypothetical protein